MRRLLLTLAAVALGFAYLYAFTYATGFAAAVETPDWWFSAFGKSGRAALVWLTLLHLAAITVVSLPFAWIIGRFYGRLAAPLALGITAAICVFIEIPVLSTSFPNGGPLLRGLWFLETIVLLLVLPAAVWAFRGWPSNYRIERTRDK